VLLVHGAEVPLEVRVGAHEDLLKGLRAVLTGTIALLLIFV
jgi:hypothetical protein